MVNIKKVTVLIVDDSALIRKLLHEIISSSDFLEVVGSCADPFEAREKIKQLNPDVITLDVEMPRMDGITFLKNLMRLRPMPVLMISTLTERGSEITLQALELGAVDYIAKPKVAVAEKLTELTHDIVTKIRIAAKANVHAHTADSSVAIKPIKPAIGKKVLKDDIRLIVIGASTGGVEATKRVLSFLPKEMPPIVIVQHMPAGFTGSYAKRLDSLLPATVSEFSGGDQVLQANHIYIANGAQGLASIKNTGAITVAQDEASSVVWGMPRVAIEQGSANYVLSLDKIGPFLIERCYG